MGAPGFLVGFLDAFTTAFTCGVQVARLGIDPQTRCSLLCERTRRTARRTKLLAAGLTWKREKAPLSRAGGGPAMGGQQVGTDMILVEITGRDQIVSFDLGRGLVEVQAGGFWPE